MLPSRKLTNRAMSDDQPTYKVTDRRLFNADGSQRDLPAAEKPEPKPEPVTANAAAAAAASAETQAEQAETPPPVESESEAEEEFTEEELVDARDPAGFVSFMMSIA